MTTMEVIPSMTTMEVLAAFRYLVDVELRKKSNSDSMVFREGCQEGYVQAIVDRYGTASSQESERAYNNKESWTHVVAQIIGDHLTDWADTFENLEDIIDLDFDAFSQAINDAVANFALRNPKKLHTALKTL